MKRIIIGLSIITVFMLGIYIGATVMQEQIEKRVMKVGLKEIYTKIIYEDETYKNTTTV